MSNKITVISYTVIKNGIELYTPNDKVIVSISTYDTEAIIKQLARYLGNKGSYQLDLDKYLINAEVDIEKESFGIISFVKRAYHKVRTLLKNDDGSERILEDVYEEPTTVLVVKKDDKTLEIPNGDKIKEHIKHAVKKKNLKGIQNFFERMAKVQDTRGHSQQDLLRFLERCDMPIADDGSIVAYKTLCVGKGDHNGMYVDPHSRNVPQNLGSLVEMDPDKVDPDRRNECSQGLHIARREYLTGYRGDEVFIVKIAPEDVIAVPEYDGSKMRVASYHIVGKLSSAGRDAIFAGRSIEGIAFDESIISDIIAGRHIGIVHTVFIGGPNGTKLKINNKEQEVKKETKPEPVKESKSEEKVGTKTKKSVKKPTKKELVASLLAKLVEETKQENRVRIVQQLIVERKTSKVSWKRLDQPNLTDDLLLEYLKDPSKSVIVDNAVNKEPKKIDISKTRKTIKKISKEEQIRSSKKSKK